MYIIETPITEIQVSSPKSPRKAPIEQATMNIYSFNFINLTPINSIY